MSHLFNALATTEQLESSKYENALPMELQDSVRYSTARLTQAASILLRLPQSIAAQAVVTLFRYWLANDMMQYEFSDVSAASVYLTAKISASPRSLRSISNVYAYLLSSSSCLEINEGGIRNVPESYYVSESSYIQFRDRILNIEGQIMNSIGFTMHVALPHPLAVTYLQTLGVFGASHAKSTGPLVVQRAIEYLNNALLSPQMLYITHQPYALATAAIYLAARDVEIKMPELEWWEVFDTDREDLGFLALSLKSFEGWVKMEKGRWSDKSILQRSNMWSELKKRGHGATPGPEDEEAEMMRLLDEKTV